MSKMLDKDEFLVLFMAEDFECLIDDSDSTMDERAMRVANARLRELVANKGIMEQLLLASGYVKGLPVLHATKNKQWIEGSWMDIAGDPSDTHTAYLLFPRPIKEGK